MEIERRFLVKNDSWKQEPFISIDYIWQGYLSFDPKRTVRVRTMGNKGYITVKGLRQNGENEEFETEISYEEAQRMLNLVCFKPVLQKNRYVVRAEKSPLPENVVWSFPEPIVNWEIDVYYADWEGLVIVEIELPEIDLAIELPDWVGEEITNDPTYFNGSLALEIMGEEEWKEIHWS